jgi:WD40 repeat protein/energy-coupling factor transporter ATP-binding protein EcfA2
MSGVGLIGRVDAVGEVFISHSSADLEPVDRIVEIIRQAGHSIFFDSDREAGINPGAAWQRTLFRELRICDAVVFVNSESGQASKWCHFELAVAAELGKRIYSIDLVRDLAPHPLLQPLQGIRLQITLEASIQRLVNSLDADGLTGSKLRWERGRPPYPGLAALDVDDAGVFFGREEDILGLRARVDRPLGQHAGDLVVVVGPSGAGKSSLVRAGLAARLALPRSGWAVARPFEPGIRPLDRLESRLAALVPGQLVGGECRQRLLGEGLAAFGEWLLGQPKVGAERLLITVDQAEQLATITSPADREEFLAVLGTALGLGSPVTAVMTARSDRFDDIQRLPVIGPMIQAPFVIAPVNRSQLAAVIEGPAGRADLAFAPGLAGRLVDDAVRGSNGEAADALPFLAFALREMYDLAEREGRTTFTDLDYERVGRIDGAISKRTEAAEAALAPESELALNDLLSRFVTLSEDRLPAGRPVSREQLTAEEQAVVKNLEDQRLLTGTSDVVRLAHERLITAWPRLARTVADRRDDLLLQARLERQANDWQQGNGGLLRRDAVNDALSWLVRAEPATRQTTVADYIRASQKALRRRQARAVRRRSLNVALTLAALAGAVATWFQRSDALSYESRFAQSEVMAANAINLLSVDPTLGMLLSLQAYERAPTLQAESALIEAIKQSPGSPPLSYGAVTSVAFSPNGQTLAVGYHGDMVALWNVATQQITPLEVDNPVSSVAFSPDGKALAVADSSNDIGLWNVATGKWTPDVFSEGSPIFSLAFSPDGKILAVGDSGDDIDPLGDIGLWNVAKRQLIRALPERGPVSSVAFSPDGATLAAGGADGSVGLWKVATRRLTDSLLEGSQVSNVAFSPDGKTLAVGDADGVKLWDAATRRRIATLPEGSEVSSVAFSPDGKVLVAGDYLGDAAIWNTSSWQPIADLTEASGGSPVTSAAFSKNNQILALGYENRSIAFFPKQPWNLTQGAFKNLICDEVHANMTPSQWAAYVPGQPYKKTCTAYS